MQRRKFWFVLIAIVLSVCMLFSFVGCEMSWLPDNWLSGDGNGNESNGIGDGENDNNDNENNGDVENDNENNGGGEDDESGILGFEMPEGGFDTETPVEITFYHNMGMQLRYALDSAIDRFNEIYPNITVKHEFIGGYDDIAAKINTDLKSGEQPNLAFCYSDHVPVYNQLNAVLSLDGFMPDGEYSDMTVTNAVYTEALGLTQAQADNYIHAFFAEGSVYGDEHTYTLPFAKSTEVLYYNKTFFNKHSDVLTAPDGNTTWEDIFETCKKIKKIDPRCTPLGIESESNLFITLCEQYNSPYTSAIGEHYLFNNDTNKAFVKEFKDWHDAGLFTTTEINKAYVSNLFTTGMSYLSIGSTAGAQYYAPYPMGGNTDFEVGIVSIPQINPENRKHILQGPSLCIFKQDDPQEVLASWLFAKFITTDVEFQATYSMTSGYMPVINSVLENDVYRSYLATKNGYTSGINALSVTVCIELFQTNAYYTSPAFVGSDKARKEVGILMAASLMGTKTIEDAFSDAITECKNYA